MVISSEKIQDTQIYLLKFDHCEKQRMIIKSIKKHSIIDSKRITLEWATLEDIELQLWVMRVVHKWDIINTNIEMTGFESNLQQMFRCEIDYIAN